MKTVSFVVPVYNEEDSITPFLDRVTAILKGSPYIFEFIFINDGSRDSTLDVLLQCSHSVDICVVNLSRNFGKEAALTAGIKYAHGDAVIPMDVDLQDPPELLLDMFAAWENGADVVLAKRVDRASDGWLKRKTAAWFYKIHNRLSETSIPENVGDFRLMNRRVVDAVLSLGERRRFMKGILSWVGFNSVTLEYTRPQRAFGKTKFSGWKLWNFGLEGLTSFSTVPLRVWSYVGLAVSFYAFCHAVFLLSRTLIFGREVPGYASLMIAVLFLGGIQLIGIGVLGEYIGRIYVETKKRPLYIVEGVYERKEHKSSSTQADITMRSAICADIA